MRREMLLSFGLVRTPLCSLYTVTAPAGAPSKSAHER